VAGSPTWLIPRMYAAPPGWGGSGGGGEEGIDTVDSVNNGNGNTLVGVGDEQGGETVLPENGGGTNSDQSPILWWGGVANQGVLSGTVRLSDPSSAESCRTMDAAAVLDHEPLPEFNSVDQNPNPDNSVIAVQSDYSYVLVSVVSGGQVTFLVGLSSSNTVTYDTQPGPGITSGTSQFSMLYAPRAYATLQEGFVELTRLRDGRNRSLLIDHEQDYRNMQEQERNTMPSLAGGGGNGGNEGNGNGSATPCADVWASCMIAARAAHATALNNCTFFPWDAIILGGTIGGFVSGIPTCGIGLVPGILAGALTGVLVSRIACKNRAATQFTIDSNKCDQDFALCVDIRVRASLELLNPR